MISRLAGRVLLFVALAAVSVLSVGCDGGTVGVGIGVGYPYGPYDPSGPWGPTTTWIGGPVIR